MRAAPVCALISMALVHATGTNAEPHAAEGNRRIASFAKAKRFALEVWAGRRETFYCGCPFSEDRRPDLAVCGYVSPNSSIRAERIEWEHVVPAEAFGQRFVAWRDGHPDCVDR